MGFNRIVDSRITSPASFNDKLFQFFTGHGLFSISQIHRVGQRRLIMQCPVWMRTKQSPSV